MTKKRLGSEPKIRHELKKRDQNWPHFRKCDQNRSQLWNLFWQRKPPHMADFFDFSGRNFMKDPSSSFLLLPLLFHPSFLLLPASSSSLLPPFSCLLPASSFLFPPSSFLSSFSFSFLHFDETVMIRWCFLCWRSQSDVKIWIASETEKRHACETISGLRSSPVLCVTGNLLIFSISKRDQNRSHYRTLQSKPCETNDSI